MCQQIFVDTNILLNHGCNVGSSDNKENYSILCKCFFVIKINVYYLVHQIHIFISGDTQELNKTESKNLYYIVPTTNCLPDDDLVPSENNDIIVIDDGNSEEYVFEDNTLSLPFNNISANAPSKCKWPENATKLLLETYKILYPKSLKKKKMYEKIQLEMAKQKHFYTVSQIDYKLKNLEKAFKNKLLNKKSTGRGRLDIQFEQ